MMNNIFIVDYIVTDLWLSDLHLYNYIDFSRRSNDFYYYSNNHYLFDYFLIDKADSLFMTKINHKGLWNFFNHRIDVNNWGLFVAYFSKPSTLYSYYWSDYMTSWVYYLKNSSNPWFNFYYFREMKTFNLYWISNFQSIYLETPKFLLTSLKSNGIILENKDLENIWNNYIKDMYFLDNLNHGNFFSQKDEFLYYFDKKSNLYMKLNLISEYLLIFTKIESKQYCPDLYKYWLLPLYKEYYLMYFLSIKLHILFLCVYIYLYDQFLFSYTIYFNIIYKKLLSVFRQIYISFVVFCLTILEFYLYTKDRFYFTFLYSFQISRSYDEGNYIYVLDNYEFWLRHYLMSTVVDVYTVLCLRDIYLYYTILINFLVFLPFYLLNKFIVKFGFFSLIYIYIYILNIIPVKNFLFLLDIKKFTKLYIDILNKYLPFLFFEGWITIFFFFNYLKFNKNYYLTPKILEDDLTLNNKILDIFKFLYKFDNKFYGFVFKPINNIFTYIFNKFYKFILFLFFIFTKILYSLNNFYELLWIIQDLYKNLLILLDINNKYLNNIKKILCFFNTNNIKIHHKILNIKYLYLKIHYIFLGDSLEQNMNRFFIISYIIFSFFIISKIIIFETYYSSILIFYIFYLWIYYFSNIIIFLEKKTIAFIYCIGSMVDIIILPIICWIIKIFFFCFKITRYIFLFLFLTYFGLWDFVFNIIYYVFMDDLINGLDYLKSVLVFFNHYYNLPLMVSLSGYLNLSDFIEAKDYAWNIIKFLLFKDDWLKDTWDFIPNWWLTYVLIPTWKLTYCISLLFEEIPYTLLYYIYYTIIIYTLHIFIFIIFLINTYDSFILLLLYNTSYYMWFYIIPKGLYIFFYKISVVSLNYFKVVYVFIFYKSTSFYYLLKFWDFFYHYVFLLLMDVVYNIYRLVFFFYQLLLIYYTNIYIIIKKVNIILFLLSCDFFNKLLIFNINLYYINFLIFLNMNFDKIFSTLGVSLFHWEALAIDRYMSWYIIIYGTEQWDFIDYKKAINLPEEDFWDAYASDKGKNTYFGEFNLFSPKYLNVWQSFKTKWDKILINHSLHLRSDKYSFFLYYYLFFFFLIPIKFSNFNDLKISDNLITHYNSEYAWYKAEKLNNNLKQDIHNMMVDSNEKWSKSPFIAFKWLENTYEGNIKVPENLFNNLDYYKFFSFVDEDKANNYILRYVNTYLFLLDKFYERDVSLSSELQSYFYFMKNIYKPSNINKKTRFKYKKLLRFEKGLYCSIAIKDYKKKLMKYNYYDVIDYIMNNNKYIDIFNKDLLNYLKKNTYSSYTKLHYYYSLSLIDLLKEWNTKDKYIATVFVNEVSCLREEGHIERDPDIFFFKDLNSKVFNFFLNLEEKFKSLNLNYLDTPYILHKTKALPIFLKKNDNVLIVKYLLNSDLYNLIYVFYFYTFFLISFADYNYMFKTCQFFELDHMISYFLVSFTEFCDYLWIDGGNIGFEHNYSMHVDIAATVDFVYEDIPYLYSLNSEAEVSGYDSNINPYSDYENLLRGTHYHTESDLELTWFAFITPVTYFIIGYLNYFIMLLILLKDVLFFNKIALIIKFIKFIFFMFLFRLLKNKNIIRINTILPVKIKIYNKIKNKIHLYFYYMKLYYIKTF